MEDIKVTVVCRTYNHERYIRQCLESLVSQETDFNYEIIVHDDASTDATASIVKEFEEKYPNLVKPIYQKENQYQKKVDTYKEWILPKSKGEFLAMCEGDDFWTDPKKLQKQYDFMSQHPEYSLCGHGAYYANEDGSLLSGRYFTAAEETKTIPTEEVLGGWKMATASLMYRKDLRAAATPIPFKGDCPNGDFALAVYMALHGKVYYINDLMCAYRRVSVGSLGWNWRMDPEKAKAAKIKFLEMLDRIDAYSEYKYHNIIENFKKDEQFQLHLLCGNYKEAKKDKEHFSTFSSKRKIKLFLRSYFPKIYYFLKKTAYTFRYKS